MGSRAVPPTRLLVVRHGRSEWNTAGRWQGHADIVLDHTGELQAVAAAEVLGQFDAIWASDLQRALRTAQIVAALLGVGPVRTDPRLREKDVGPWEGLTHAEVEREWPGFLAARRRPDGFEDEDHAAARVLTALDEIGAEHPGGEVLVVSHGGVIRAARRALGADAPHLDNLSGGWFELRDGRLRAGESVQLVDTAALDRELEASRAGRDEPFDQTDRSEVL
ncbi:MAG: histidine phosphatase family protein [Acidimicrobiales bacterium]